MESLASQFGIELRSAISPITKLAFQLFGLCLTSVLFLSCNANSQNQISATDSKDVELIAIEEIKPSKLSDVVDSISYTRLEYHPDHRARRIDKVIIEDGFVYTFDYSFGKSLSVYSLDGSFQFALTNPGQGPNEYRAVHDFLVDKGKIEILDIGGKMLFFDEQGAFERSIKLPFSAQAFIKIGDDYLFQTGKKLNELGRNGNSCEVIQYNLESKKTDCLLEINNDRRINGSWEKHMLKRVGNEYYYATGFNDTIYSKQDGYFSPRFIMDFSLNGLPEEIFDKNVSVGEFVQFQSNNPEKFSHSAGIQVSSDFLITRYSSDGLHHLIYDFKKRNKAALEFRVKNDVDGGLPIPFTYVLNNRDIIVVYDSEYVLGRASELQKEKNQFSEKEQAFLDFANNLDTDSSLAMISYHLK